MLQEFPERKMHVGRIFEFRKISVNQIQQREKHSQGRNIRSSIIVRTVYEHTANKGGYDPGRIERSDIEPSNRAHFFTIGISFQKYIQSQADKGNHCSLEDKENCNNLCGIGDDDTVKQSD